MRNRNIKPIISAITTAKKELRKYASKKKAKILSRFFKTGKGEYGEGDKFIGVVVPDIRKVAKEYQDLPLKEAIMLLKSPIHEERLLALLIMALIFQKTQTEAQKKAVYKAYLANTKYINNWDLVDLSSHEIVGSFLLNRSKKELYDLSKSKSLWERRLSIVSTYRFIRNDLFRDTLKIAHILVKDNHDLIHKAVGWMLREVGKRDLKALERFLKRYYKSMPRTMLRYSIEKFAENKRFRYLNGKV